jgi:hypothetical protein
MSHVEIILRENGAQAILVEDGLKTMKPTSIDEVLRVLKLQGNQDTGDLAFGVRRVKKSAGITYVVLQCQARIRRVTGFKREFIIPVPNHLIIFSFTEGAQGYVYQNSGMVALAGNMLYPQTQGYEFPFCNVTSTWTCWGYGQNTVSQPRNLNSGIDDLIGIFWGSDFNDHLSAGKFPVHVGDRTIFTMEELLTYLDGKAEFPVEALLPAKDADQNPTINTYTDWLAKFGLII